MDEEMDALLGIGHRGERKRGIDHVGNHVIDGRAEEDDAIDQQAGIDVVTAFPAPRLLDHMRDQKVIHTGAITGICWSIFVVLSYSVGATYSKPERSVKRSALGPMYP